MFEVWDCDYWCLKLIIKESDGLVNWFFYCKFNVRMLSIIGAFKELLLVCLLYSICSTFLAYFWYILFSKAFLIINNKSKYSILDKNFFCTNVQQVLSEEELESSLAVLENTIRMFWDFWISTKHLKLFVQWHAGLNFHTFPALWKRWAKFIAEALKLSIEVGKNNKLKCPLN